jgi:phage FluMu gp28-like protein
MADRRKDALEQLRAQVEVAQAAARANRIWSEELDALGQRVESHKLGTVESGWVNPYPKDDPRHLLLEYQFVVFHDESRFKAALQSRQTGKDFEHAGETVEDCLKRPGTEWMIAAPSERQALDSLDQDKLWAEAFNLVVANYTEEREGSSSQTLLKSAEITFSNGSRIRSVPGRPDTVRGRSTNVRITEFDFLEDPTATWRALLPSITNPLRGGEKKVRVYSTPNGKGGMMYKIMTKPDTPKMRWSRHLVTIYHAVLMGLPVDVAQIREAMDDADGFAQEFLCQFLDGSNVLLPYDLIQLAESLEATEAWDLATAGTAHPVFLGIDFGRTNDPTVCWMLQLIGDILWTHEVLVLDNVSTPEQETILRDRIKGAHRVCFDYTGPGIGLGDYLVANHGGQWDPKAHKFGKIELCTFTTGFKRDLFPKLRQKFLAPTKLRIPVSTTVREDLHQMQQVISNGEYNYWSPRTKAGHSDRCTALALAVRAADMPISIGRFSRVSNRSTRAAAARRTREIAG